MYIYIQNEWFGREGIQVPSFIEYCDCILRWEV